MTRTSTGMRRRMPEQADFGEIQNLPEVPLQPRPRTQLKEAEQQRSIPPCVLPPRLPESLERALGTRLTVDNPVWVGDPIPVLRSLQLKLVEYSLSLEAAARTECLTAISLVERAVRLRLRWLQMQRSELERAVIDEQAGARDEKEGKSRAGTG